MLYNGIVNFPQERSIVTWPWVYWNDVLTPEEIQTICDYCSPTEMKEAETLGGIQDIRVSKIHFYGWNKELEWFFDRMNNYIQFINNRWYGFDLNGYTEFQYTEYHGGVAGHYGWHMDTAMGNKNLPADMLEPRKLSLSLVLNNPGIDFEGGEFQINLGNEDKPDTMEQKAGRVLAFPSFMIHQVKPVTKGVRKSIVIWVTGPKFR